MKCKKISIIIYLFFIINFAFSQENNGFSIDDVNIFDRLIMNSYSKTLDYAGTSMLAVSLLTPTILFSAPSQDYWKIGLEYAQTIIFASMLKELFKLCVDRPRPYMYFNGMPTEKVKDGDWNDSFISGHSTLSFAAASFSSYLFCQYYPDSKWKFPVIFSSFGLATTTAILRLCSGNHFMTDVICGAIVGSSVGLIVPWLNSLWIKPLYKLNKSKDLQITLSPVGFYLNMKI